MPSAPELWERLEHGPGSRHDETAPPTLVLTSHAGLVLLGFLAIVYVTGIAFDSLRAVHFAVGFALIPVLLVKVAVVTWRMVNYYAGREPYRSAGPPWILPRLLAVPLLASVAVATVSGIVLWALGVQRGIWSTIHTDSVVVLLGLGGLHALIYLRRAIAASAPALTSATFSRAEKVVIWSLVVATVVAVAAIALEPTWHGRADSGPRIDGG